jgi:hypothetical protein
MTWSDHTGLSGDLPATAQAGGRTRRGRVSGYPAATLATTAGQERVGQLLGDAVNLLLKAGLQLASVHCRLNEPGERQAVENVTSQLDAALAEIRHLSVRVALTEQTHEDRPNGTP